MGKLVDLAGLRFGKWAVIGGAPTRRSGSTYWACRCDCGTEKDVAATSLRQGRSTNCGCGATPRISLNQREYNSWNSMRGRCRDGRKWYAGVTIVDRWTGERGFQNFLEDMGPRPPGTSLDRVDNDKGYSPENCRWATAREQAMNRSVSRIVELDGRLVSLHKAIEIMQRRMKKGDRAYRITTLMGLV